MLLCSSSCLEQIVTTLFFGGPEGEAGRTIIQDSKHPEIFREGMTENGKIVNVNPTHASLT